MEDNTKQFELSYYYHEISIIHQKNNKNRKICDNIIEIPFPLFQGWLRNAVFLYSYIIRHLKIRFSLLFTLTNLDFDLQGREN